MKGRVLLCLLYLFGLSFTPTSGAQSNLENEQGAAAPYEDTLIDNGGLAPLEGEGDGVSYNAEGWSRGLRLEAYTSQFDQGGKVTRETGLTFDGHIDTPDYGALSLNATLRNPLNDSLLSIWQRGMPFDGGWQANNGVGMLNTLGIDLSRNQYRFFLPTFPVAGVVTEWFRYDKLQLQASAGEPGLYNGLRIAGFERLGGQIVTAGAQSAVGADWQGGIQLIDARNVRVNTDPADSQSNTSAQAWYTAAAWQGSQSRFQANVLGSAANHGQERIAVWLDASTRQGRYRHNYGLFRLEPEMFWGYTPVASDIEGGYYRIQYQSQQWLWDAGLDAVESVSGRGGNGLYATGGVRYQWDRSLGVGLGGVARSSDNDGWSSFVFVDKQTRLGISRVEVDVVSEQGDRRGTQIILDQAWPMPVGTSLSTSISQGRESNAGQAIQRTSFAISGGSDLFNNLSVDGNVRWSNTRGFTKSTGLSASIDLNWRINSRWSLATTYYENRTNDQGFLTVDPLIPSTTTTTTEKNKALFVVLRYQSRAGTALAPLGGAPGSGAGTVVGYLFLDANDDQRRDASEVGAANVTILLDGRFAARTDSQGSFEFSLVAAGRHQLTVIPDNLPLPWALANDGRLEVTVRTRETTLVNLGATKLR